MNSAAKQGKGKGYIRLVILIALIAVLVRAVVGISKRAPNTALVGYGEIIIAEKAIGLIVRDEKVIKAPISGRITYVARENVRVPVNTRIFEMKNDKVDSNIMDTYKEIDERLEALESLEINPGISATSAKDINESLSKIAFLIDEGDLAMVYYERERLEREISHSLAANTTQSEKQALIQKKEELDSIIEGGIKSEFAPFSGVPVYTLDGYEEILRPDNLKDVLPSKVAPIRVNSVDLHKELKIGDPVMKVVDNHLWYFVCNLSEDFAENLQQGSTVTLEILREKDNDKVRAKVEYVRIEDGEALAIFQSKDFFTGLYQKREIELNVVKGKYSGLIVPLSAITERDGGYTVEVLDADKTVEKKIAIKGHDNDNAAVEESDLQSGIKIYDKVVLRKSQGDRYEYKR